MRLATLTVIVGGLAWFIWDRRDEVLDLELVHPLALLVVVIGIVGNLAAAAGWQRAMLLDLGLHIYARTSWYLTVVATGYNAFLPLRAGAGVRATYLRREHGLSYVDFTSTFALYSLMTALVSVTVGTVAISVIGAATVAVALALGTAVLTGVAAIAWLIARLNRPPKRLERLIHSARIVAQRSWSPMVLFAGAQNATSILAFWGALTALGVHVSVAEVTFITASGILSTVLAVTPSGIGVFESFAAASAALLGTSAAPVLAAGLLQRALLLVVLAVLVPLSARQLHLTDGAVKEA